jgi:hypothetical protein
MFSQLIIRYHKHNLPSMKKIFFVLLVFFPGIAFCQNLPVQLNARVLKTGNHLFTLRIEVQIKEGWHAFAISDPVLGIEKCTILLENRNILFPDNSETGSDCKTVLIKDSLFGGKSFSVFINKIAIEKTVAIPDSLPFLLIKLEALVSDNIQIVPVEISREVNLKI